MADKAKSMNVDDAIMEYYQLKQKYKTKLDTQRNRILKNTSLNSKQKLRRYQEIQKQCIHCGNIGGTIFKNSERFLTAVCGAATPCNLNIKIDRGFYKNMYEQEKELSDNLNKLKELIILLKLSLVFNLESKDVIMGNFEKAKQNLSQLSKIVFKLQTDLINITLKPQNKIILDTAYTELFNSKERLKTLLEELKTTNNLRLARDMAEIFHSEITPLTEKIRELKYDYVDVETIITEEVKHNKKEKIVIHNLVETPYTLNQLIQPISNDASAKVISFIK